MGRNKGKIETPDDSPRKGKLKEARTTEIQCFPLYSILLALNRTTVDYFSLDVEGAGIMVLKTIPFDKLNIRVLTVEFTHGSNGKDEILSFMEAQGYKTVMSVVHPKKIANDLVFVSKNG